MQPEFEGSAPQRRNRGRASQAINRPPVACLLMVSLPNMAAAVLELKEGQISDVVETASGVHLIMRTG